jgi:hypothetical protein
MRCSRERWENKVAMVTNNSFSLLEVKIVKEATQGHISFETSPK